MIQRYKTQKVFTAGIDRQAFPFAQNIWRDIGKLTKGLAQVKLLSRRLEAPETIPHAVAVKLDEGVIGAEHHAPLLQLLIKAAS